MLAEELHFGRASTRLGISQPTLSERIRSLEATTRTVLFDRHTREVKLSVTGRDFLPLARSSLDNAQQLFRAARGLAAGTRGLRVGAAPYALRAALAIKSFLAGFGEGDSPEVRLLDDDYGINEVQGGTLDAYLFLHSKPLDEPGLRWVEVTQTECGVTSIPTHPVATAPTVDVHSLEPYPLIAGGAHSTRQFADVTSFIKSHGLNMTLISPSEESMNKLFEITSGSCIGLGNPLISDWLTYVGLVCTTIVNPTIPVHIGLVTRQDLVAKRQCGVEAVAVALRDHLLQLVAPTDAG